MIILGIILLLIGLFVKIAILWTIGIVLVLVGLVLVLLGSMGRAVGGRRRYYLPRLTHSRTASQTTRPNRDPFVCDATEPVSLLEANRCVAPDSAAAAMPILAR